MNDNKLFLEELRYIVENEFVLNENVIDQLQERFDKNPFLIIQLYQILLKNKAILPFFTNIEATIYDYIINEEMLNGKTNYGATLFVADMFDTTQTYIKCKVNQSRQNLQKIS